MLATLAHSRFARVLVHVCAVSAVRLSVSTPPWGVGGECLHIKKGGKVGGGVSRLVAK